MARKKENPNTLGTVRPLCLTGTLYRGTNQVVQPSSAAIFAPLAPSGSRERKLTPSRPGRSCATTCPWSRSLLPCRFGAFLGLRVRMGAADPVSSFRAWLSFYCLVAGSKPRLRGQANSIRTAQLGFGRCLRHNQFASARLLLVHVIRERTFCGRTGLPAQVILAHVGSIRCARHERWPGSWHSGFYPLP